MLIELRSKLVNKRISKNPFWKILFFLKDSLRKNTKIFGIGMPKTGTKTLGECMVKLGFKHCSYRMDLAVQIKKKDLVKTFEVANKYDSFEDWPWFLIYKELDKKYPNSKFILTLRKDPSSYINSLKKHRVRQGVFKKDFKKPDWWGGVFDYPPNEFNDKNFLIEYKKHNEEVIRYFKYHPEKLLILCWEKGDKWKKLCQFLGIKKIPNIPFPHKNKSLN